MKISLANLQARADERPSGYLEDCLAAGELRADGFVYLKASAYHALRAKYSPISPLNPIPPIPVPSPPRLTGLGDAIARIAKPIARALDRVAGTNLENCKPCAKRQAKLNQAFPFPKPPNNTPLTGH